MKILRIAGKSSIKIVFVILIPPFFFVTGACAWMARYNGPADSWDRAYALAVDGSGNTYVTGASESSVGNTDYCTIKYDEYGRRLWVSRYNGTADDWDKAYSIAVDAQEFVYVTGESWGAGTDQDCVTIKYDNNGNEEWVARYNGPADGRDVASALCIDDSGNVYVTGFSYGIGTLGDYTTIKYDNDGNELWVSRYDGPASGLDLTKAIAVDEAGNVYVTGESVDQNDSYTTIKYDSDGNELWVARYSATVSWNDVGKGIAVDRLGNVYVTGFSYGSGTEFDYATIKYDENGNELWVERYNGPGNYYDVGNAISLDTLGNVYVTGQSYGTGGEYDYATIKYDTDGHELWTARYQGPAGDFDIAKAITLDEEANVYVTGRSHGWGTDWDYTTIKYDTNGNEEWISRFNYRDDSDDRACAVAVDERGNVYVTGKSQRSETGNDYVTIKYSPDLPHHAVPSE